MRRSAQTGRSAYGAAVIKAIERFTPKVQRLFDDPVIIDLLPASMRFATRSAWVRQYFVRLLDRGSPGIRGALLCRTRCIDEWVKNALGRGLSSVVILGAGLDTRAYRLADMAKARVFEVDLPAVQAYKRTRLLQRFGTLPAHVRFVPADFNVEGLDVLLAKAGLPEREAALFVCEGVTQYLQPSSVDDLLRMVAARPTGTELIFTYILQEVVTGQYACNRSEGFRKSAARRPEPWVFGIEPTHLKAFLRERLLTLCEEYGAEEHRTRYVQPLGRDLLVSEIERVVRACVG